MKQDETIKFNEVSGERHLDLNKLMQETFVEKKMIVKKVVKKNATKKSTKK
jgi:hypothetical protein